jgi:nucleotide-binding universal stress UspA family protein
MFKHILVPLDGSELATVVLAHVATLAQPTRAKVTLLSVIERRNGRNDLDPVGWHLQKVETQRYLDEIKEQLGSFLEQEPDTQVLEGLAAERICEYAHKNECDLIAVSTHGASGQRAWRMGSVAQKVIQGAGKSLLLVRAYPRESHAWEAPLQPIHYRRILLALDGSLRAESILPAASMLAQYHETRLVLVHVIARPAMIERAPLGPDDAALLEQLVERTLAHATRYIDEISNRLPFDLRTRVLVSDNVARALWETTKDEQVDLVLISAHGASNQPVWPYGSAAANLIANGETPLLILQDLPLSEISSIYGGRAMVYPRGEEAHRFSALLERTRATAGK